jgi:hypothetical protein
MFFERCENKEKGEERELLNGVILTLSLIGAFFNSE